MFEIDNIVKTVFLIYLLIISISDVKERKISLKILMLGGVITSFGVGMHLIEKTVSYQYILGTIPGVVLIFIALMTRQVGIADGVIFVYIGLLLKYQESVAVVCVSVLIIAVFSAILLVIRKVERKHELPFIPFIAVGYLIILVIGAG